MASSAGPEVVLPLILAQLVDTTILKPELLRLIAVAFVELHWKAEAVCYEHFSPIFSAVNRYLVINIENGKLRSFDTTLVIAALATSVMVHPEFSKLLNGAPPPYSDRREAIRAYTQFWLDVLMPLPPVERAQSALRLTEAPPMATGN
jgi:hypothetical protein